jgi:hypothetical protein
MILSRDSVPGCHEKAPTSKPEISAGALNQRQRKGSNMILMHGQMAERIAENEREIAKLRAALETAMTTLDQIATTPRNAGAKRNASATLIFLRTQLVRDNRVDAPWPDRRNPA